MKILITKASMVALLGLSLVSAGWANAGSQQNQQNQKKGQQGQQGQAPSLQAPAKPGETPGAAAAPTAAAKEEADAYKLVFDARNGDPSHIIELGEAFIVKYPDSHYLGGIYGELTTAYFSTNQQDKFMVAGTKTLQLDPDNVDVLPLMAMATSRMIDAKTPDPQAQLQRAQAYGKHGIDLLNALPKPDAVDDATFTKAKNEKLAMCYSGVGVANFQLGSYADAVTALTQAVTLTASPDPVDYYLLGMADQQTSHYQDAIAAYGKCAAAPGPMQPQCKAGIDQAKKDAQTHLEAPK